MTTTAEPLCRQKRQALGLPYQKSGCQKCGSLLRPRWQCAEVDETSAGPSPASLWTLGAAVMEIARLEALNRQFTSAQDAAIRYRTALLAISEMQTIENMRRVAEGALGGAA